VTVGDQADDDADAPEDQNPYGQWTIGADFTTAIDDADNSGDRADSVGDIIRPVGEGRGSGGEHRPDGKDRFNVGGWNSPVGSPPALPVFE